MEINNYHDHESNNNSSSSSEDSDSESTEEFEDSIKLPSTSNSLSTEDLDLSSQLSSDQSKTTTPQLLIIADEEESSSSSEDSALQAEIEEIGNSESESISEKREEEFRRSPTPAASTLTSENLEPIVLKYPSHSYAPFWDLPLYFFTFPYLHSSTLLNRPGEEETQTVIDQLRDGDQLIDREGEPIVLQKIFKIQPKVDFIRFGKGSLQCKAPNFEPSFDLYVSPSCWFLYKHEKAMDCENIMNGNSISRTTIEDPADVYLLCTEKGDYVKCGCVEIATLPLDDFLAWLTKNPSAHQFKLAHRPDIDNDEWQMFPH